jgi:serine/threonine-protein kinase RsbW
LDIPCSSWLHVKTDLAALEQVLTWFDQFHHPALPRSVWLQCQLALAEGFTNAVRHAHQGRPMDTPIEIFVCLKPDYMELQVWDEGDEYDLNQVFATLSLDMDQRSEGGRGLKLMKRMADILSYDRSEDGRNCLRIVKYYSPEF